VGGLILYLVGLLFFGFNLKRLLCCKKTLKVLLYLFLNDHAWNYLLLHHPHLPVLHLIHLLYQLVLRQLHNLIITKHFEFDLSIHLLFKAEKEE